ncbi:hypothetical protein AB0P13_26075 [Rhodococcus pyridinivorans]|uniref:hypothetical protein n=1 Tax=Rhodococcus pyridinivorans TaxID=103816 RepID=UPI00341376A8
MKRSVVAAMVSMVPLVALPAAASAEPAVLPPAVTLTSDDSSITATITNPNEPRVINGFTLTCRLSIDRAPEGFTASVLPFENPDPHGTPSDPTDVTRYPQAGQTVTITRDGLPQGQYNLVGQCGQMSYGGGWLWEAGSASERVEYEIRVGPEPTPEPAPGLLGSLNLNR